MCNSRNRKKVNDELQRRRIISRFSRETAEGSLSTPPPPPRNAIPRITMVERGKAAHRSPKPRLRRERRCKRATRVGAARNQATIPEAQKEHSRRRGGTSSVSLIGFASRSTADPTTLPQESREGPVRRVGPRGARRGRIRKEVASLPSWRELPFSFLSVDRLSGRKTNARASEAPHKRKSVSESMSRTFRN